MPVWAKRIPLLDRLDKPIDGNKQLFAKPILGRNKTYRGLVAGVASALVVGAAQWLLSEQWSAVNRLEFIELDFSSYIILSLLLGFGAILGDALESFAKRQVGVTPGKAWVPFDQIDYVIGAFLISAVYIQLDTSQYLAAFFVGSIIHPISTVIGWKLGLKDQPI